MFCVELRFCLFNVSYTYLDKNSQFAEPSENEQEIAFIGGEGQELRMPLLAEESSFSNGVLFNDSDSDENSEILFSVLQSRDNSTYETEDKNIL